MNLLMSRRAIASSFSSLRSVDFSAAVREHITAPASAEDTICRGISQAALTRFFELPTDFEAYLKNMQKQARSN